MNTILNIVIVNTISYNHKKLRNKKSMTIGVSVQTANNKTTTTIIMAKNKQTKYNIVFKNALM